MRSQRVKRIKRSKKSKMSKRINKSKRTKRTKRYKRTRRTKKTKKTKRSRRKQINHRKNRKKILKGGTTMWPQARDEYLGDKKESFRLGRRTSEPMDERIQIIRELFDGELDEPVSPWTSSFGTRENPILLGTGKTELAKQYELTGEKVNEIFEEVKKKKIQGRKERIRGFFDRELDKPVLNDIFGTRELPLLSGAGKTQLAKQYGLTGEKVNEIFEEVKNKKIQEREERIFPGKKINLQGS